MSEMDSIQLAHAIEDGKPVIANCRFGFGVRVDPHPEDGKAWINVPEKIIEPGYDGPALRAWMEQIAVSWLRQVAPHRLALGADDR